MKAFLDLLDERSQKWLAFEGALGIRQHVIETNGRLSQLEKADKSVDEAQREWEAADRALRDWLDEPGNLEQLGAALASKGVRP